MISAIFFFLHPIMCDGSTYKSFKRIFISPLFFLLLIAMYQRARLVGLTQGNKCCCCAVHLARSRFTTIRTSFFNYFSNVLLIHVTFLSADINMKVPIFLLYLRPILVSFKVVLERQLGSLRSKTCYVFTRIASEN